MEPEFPGKFPDLLHGVFSKPTREEQVYRLRCFYPASEWLSDRGRIQ